jgi:AcrR family transcriptional regulator
MQERALRTRSAILAAAAEVFDAVGYRGATIDEIARRADVAKGALYFHYRTKAELAAAVVTQHHAAWGALAESAIDEADDAMTAIDLMIARVAHLYVTSAITRAGTRLENEYLDVDTALSVPFVGWIARLNALLRAGKRDGSVAADVACAASARVIVASFYGVQAVSARLNDRRDVVRRVDEWWSMFRPTLAARTAPGRRRDGR